MAHVHSVYDSDSHFSINPITRALKNEGSTKNSVIQFDHNSERFTFEIPRQVEEHDMSLCNRVEVHFLNIGSAKKETNAGVYVVDDMQLSPEDENIVILSWLISQEATQLAGSLNFLIRFACIGDDGTVEYAWHTATYSGISIANGINNGEAVVQEYPDIIADWETRIAALEKGSTGHPVKYIESDKENKVCLRDLETGIYILYGYFKPFPDSNSTIIIDNLLMHVYTGDAYTYMSCITADGIVSVYEILVDETNSYGYTYNRYRYKLDELAANAGSVEYVESLDENNIKNLLDLEAGVYKLYGYFHPFPGSPSTMTIDNRLVTVEKQDEGSHFIIHTTTNGKIRFVEVLVDESNTYGYTEDIIDISLLDLHRNVTALTAAAPRIANVELLAANWMGDASPYSQVVTIAGVTENTQVDLTPSVEQLAVFHEKDLALVTENEDGVVTVYAIGQKPVNDYVIQATITEVNIDE